MYVILFKDMFLWVIFMEINIYVQGRKFDKDYIYAFNEYSKRISPWASLKLNICKSLPFFSDKRGTMSYIVLPGAHTLSSPRLAKEINRQNLMGISRIDYYISEEISTLPLSADNASIFNLSTFCMGRELTFVVLAEQLYRAYTINNNITYHK